MFKFSDEAFQLVLEYVKDVRNSIISAGFDVKSEYLEVLMSDIENYIKFFSIKHARKRKVEIVETVDVAYAFKKFGKPEKLVKSYLRDQKTYANTERIRLTTNADIKKKIDEARSPVVLDAGCGWGRYIKRLHDFITKDFETIGVDFDILSLQYGKTINRAAIFLRADIRALPLKDEVFDVVVCSGVIHEVKSIWERKTALREFARVTKTNGYVYIIDAFTANIFANIFTRLLQHVPILGVEWIFHKKQLEKMLQENGFNVTTVGEIGLRSFLKMTECTFKAIKT
jgi:ubiquinone/menaquinone biosynthesis C-methylase UbiE